MNLSPIKKVVLRSLLRQAAGLRKQNTSLWLQSFPAIEEFQTVSATSAYEELSLFVRNFPEPMREFILDNIPTRQLDGAEFKRMVVAGFRLDPLKGSADHTAHTLECLKIMNDQMRLLKSSSVVETEKVRVVATAVYDKREHGQIRGILGEHSFYYRITIENNAEFAVRLVGRHWVFKSENSETEVPKFASGVIGLNPIIQPGRTFQYMSMAHLESDHGTMEGSFLMENMSDKTPLEVKVGMCNLNPEVYVD